MYQRPHGHQNNTYTVRGKGYGSVSPNVTWGWGLKSALKCSVLFEWPLTIVPIEL